MSLIKKSNESQLLTESGDIRVSVKRVTDRKVDLYESGTVRYFAIIENLANSKSEDVIINTNKSDNIEPSRVVLLTGMKTGENANESLALLGKIAREGMVSADIKMCEEIIKRNKLRR